MEFFAVNKSEHTVSGIVYCCSPKGKDGKVNPVPDSQNDFIQEISVLKSACENFNRDPKFNINHKGKDIDLEVLESVVLEKDTRKDGQEDPIPAGCWYLKLGGVPEEIFELISSGELNGLSIEGDGAGLEI